MSQLKKQTNIVTLADERVLEVTVVNIDLVMWDRTRVKHKWPPIAEAAFLGQTFMAWHAAKRQGLYDGTFEQFSEHDCIDIDEPDDAEDDDVIPTQPAPAAG